MMGRFYPSRPYSIAFRLVASGLVWVVVVLGGGGLVLAALFTNAVERAYFERLVDHLDALSTWVEVDAESGQLIEIQTLSIPPFERIYSGWYWQVTALAGGAVGESLLPLRSESLLLPLRSLSLRDFVLTAPLLMPPIYTDARGETTYRGRLAGPDGQILESLERRGTLAGSERQFSLIVAVDRSDLDHEIVAFNVSLAVALSVLGIGIALLLLLQLHMTLRPMRRLKNDLSAIRDDRAQHLPSDNPAELAPLAEEINDLLDHNRRLVERARRHAGDLAHALKTPLTVLRNEAQRPDRSAAASGPLESKVASGSLEALIIQQVAVMHDHVNRHLEQARQAATAPRPGSGGCRVCDVLERVARTITRLHGSDTIDLNWHCKADLSFRGDVRDLEEIFGNLLDNAGKYGGRRIGVEVSAGTESRRPILVISIDDDGPGLSTDDRERVLQRGLRLDERIPGSGLGLSIVAGIVEAYDGTMSLDASPSGGLRVLLSLPRSLAAPLSSSAARDGVEPTG